MSIESLIQREVETISPETNCADAAARMLDANVGCLVVSTPDATPVGIVTDRDLAVRVVAGRLDPEKPVREVMTSDPIFLSETTTLQGVISTMRDLRLRRMVVVDDDRRMCGIIALDDVVMHLGDSLAGVSEAIRSELRT